MNSKVSVIIPMYNSEKYIKDCINSVINQTYKNLEIIVVDDASKDLSVDIINSIKDERIKLIKLQKNNGVSIARNKGIEIAKGKYICFLDSDDIWELDKIEKQVVFIEKNNYEFIYSNYDFLCNKKSKIIDVPKKLTYNQAIKNTTIFISTVMLNMDKLQKKDIYMPNLTIGQDTATWWLILKNGISAYGMNDVLAHYRIHENSLSSNKIRAVLGAWKIYIREEMSMIKRIYCFMCYIKNAVKRRI